MAELDDLLQVLPTIAETVNAFESESVQQRAFDALLEAFRGKPNSARTRDETHEDESAQVSGRPTKRKSSRSDAAVNGESSKGQRVRRPSGTRPSVVPGLNLTPNGQKSFSQFAKDKAPANVSEMIAVAVFYLKHTAAVDKVTTNHIYTCFKDVGWRLPANLPNAVSVAASRHSLLHTGGLTDINLTSRGENLVEHDLPHAKKSK